MAKCLAWCDKARLQRLPLAIMRVWVEDIGKFETYRKEIDLNADGRLAGPGTR